MATPLKSRSKFRIVTQVVRRRSDVVIHQCQFLRPGLQHGRQPGNTKTRVIHQYIVGVSSCQFLNRNHFIFHRLIWWMKRVHLALIRGAQCITHGKSHVCNGVTSRCPDNDLMYCWHTYGLICRLQTFSVWFQVLRL